MMGVWLSLLLALGFIGVHAWQITEEARQLADALAATELVLAREQHLSQLDGLAAAAAHELGTPLATITRDRQGARARDRAGFAASPRTSACCASRRSAAATSSRKLTELPPSGEPFDRMKLSALIEEVVAPHRNFGVAIDVALPADGAAEPVGGRNPGDPLRPRQSGGERRRFRARARRDRGRLERATRSRSPSPTTGRALRRKSWTASASPMSPAPPAAPDGRRVTGRPRPRLFHRQDAAGALGRHAHLREPRTLPSAAPWSRVRWAAAISSGHGVRA